MATPTSLFFVRNLRRNVCFLTQKSNNHQKSLSNESVSPIQLVSPSLHRYLFPNTETPSTFTSHSSECPIAELPPLFGNLSNHFQHIGNEQINEYRHLMDAVFSNPPKMPTEWRLAHGWTRYINGDVQSGVDFPDEDLLFFDVEVCVSDGQAPTLAVAMSSTAWYSWCSERLVYPSRTKPYCDTLQDMIPLGSVDRSRLVIGHNVAYDRARVREEYFPKKGRTRFWDTMSMHIISHGMSDRQRLTYSTADLSNNENVNTWKSRVSMNNLEAVHRLHCREKKGSSLKMDKEPRKMFVKGGLDEIRSHFQVHSHLLSLYTCICEMQKLTTYCAVDVQATFEVFKELYPQFKQWCPHPASWFGMLELCSAYLPITNNWCKFVNSADKMVLEADKNLAEEIVRIAREMAEQLGRDNRYKSDPWFWSEDWTIQPKTGNPRCIYSIFIGPLAKSHRWMKRLSKRLNSHHATAQLDQELDDVSLRNLLIPRLFGLCWNRYPLHYIRNYGWVYFVPEIHSNIPIVNGDVNLRGGMKTTFPAKEIYALVDKNKSKFRRTIGMNALNIDFPGCKVYQLPHSGGPKKNVGNPISRNMLKFVDDGTLWATRYQDTFKRMAKLAVERSYWISNRDRVHTQLTVWLPVSSSSSCGVIVPCIIPSGTVTRRAVEKLWMTAANPSKDRIGSELKAMIEAPQGRVFVGSDVDSQEQWIAALFGDWYKGENRVGSIPFSRMLLSGDKKTGTDLHSVVAKEIGLSRDCAKVLNYGRLYGAGAKFAEQFISENLVNMKRSVRNIVKKLYKTTKGTRTKQLRVFKPTLNGSIARYILENDDKELKDLIFFQKGRYYLPAGKIGTKLDIKVENFEDYLFTKVKNESSCEKIKLNLIVSDLYMDDTVAFWRGGFESDLFNCLEEIADRNQPTTPVLRCRLSSSLASEGIKADRQQFISDLKRTRVNWVVQSSGVDFLHLLLSCMSWLCAHFDIDARFAISIHDEIHYLTSTQDRYRCALALQLSNLLVRAVFSHTLGINQLPQSVAFFSKVNIDRVLRKDVDMECETPSNPSGLSKGYGIPPGESLTLSEICEYTGGCLHKSEKKILRSSAC